ncbi:MAG: hypothetical protein KGL57_00795 [Burkholderiales bacterium]|nr:hypothetical protein [Burkholderiales bacterium]
MLGKIAGFIMGFGVALAAVLLVSMWAGVMPRGLGWLLLIFAAGSAGSRWLSGLWPNEGSSESF